jgi:hypothetical protein
MAHFVNIPIPRNPGDNGISTLSLKDPNGTCNIGVWGMPAKSTVQASDNPRFLAGKSYTSGSVQVYYLRGLKAGDEIAAFLPTGERYTSWLPIKLVKGDHLAAQRAAGTLPRSAHKNNFILDSHGSLQRKPPLKEEDWTKAIENNILTIKGHPLGAQVLAALTRDITFTPRIASSLNANSAVNYTPQQWAGDKPGNRSDEVLFHELVHLLENNFNRYVNASDGLEWHGTDFLTVTVSNMYSSLIGRPLRKDHAGFSPMPANYATNAAAFKAAHNANFNSVQTRLPSFFAAWAASSAGWNPFK